MTHFAATRSNYFTPKNREVFDAWLKNFHYEEDPEIWEGEPGSNTIAFGFYDTIPSSRTPFNPEDAHDYDELHGNEFYAELAEHLEDGQVAIVESVSAEKLKSLGGSATAVHSDGRIINTYFDQLDELVEKEWGVTPTPAQY